MIHKYSMRKKNKSVVKKKKKRNYQSNHISLVMGCSWSHGGVSSGRPSLGKGMAKKAVAAI